MGKSLKRIPRSTKAGICLSDVLQWFHWLIFAGCAEASVCSAEEWGWLDRGWTEVVQGVWEEGQGSPGREREMQEGEFLMKTICIN